MFSSPTLRRQRSHSLFNTRFKNVTNRAFVSSMDGINPFQDPARASEAPSTSGTSVKSDTLIVSRDASLTLGTDSLIVLDESLAQEKSRCCGLFARKSAPTRSIPFYNILWAELSEFDITIHYAHPASADVVRVAFVNYPVDKTQRQSAKAFVDEILARAYDGSQQKKRIKVLVNPFGGKGSAQKWYLRDIEPIFAAAKCEIDVERTKFSGHAVEIAEKLDTDAYDVIAGCSGDGIPHEIFNGLARKKDAARALAKLAVVQLPCGTGNAMSLNLNGTSSPSLAALAVVKGRKTPLDLVSITQGDKRTISFLSQAFGIVAETDLGTENMRWMGSARFTVGLLVRLLGKTIYPCEVAIHTVEGDKHAIRESYNAHIAKESPLRKSLEDSRQTILDVRSTAGPEPDGSLGLPPLKFGTVGEPLPEGWELRAYPTIGNFYSGNMSWMTADTNFFQAALPSDGCMDLVCIDGHLPRWDSIKSLLAVGNGTFFNMPYVDYRKISAYRLIPKDQYVPGPWQWVGFKQGCFARSAPRKREGYVSIDGESFPFEPFQVEVHRGLGTCLSKTGRGYEAPRLP